MEIKPNVGPSRTDSNKLWFNLYKYLGWVPIAGKIIATIYISQLVNQIIQKIKQQNSTPTNKNLTPNELNAALTKEASLLFDAEIGHEIVNAGVPSFILNPTRKEAIKKIVSVLSEKVIKTTTSSLQSQNISEEKVIVKKENLIKDTSDEIPTYLEEEKLQNPKGVSVNTVLIVIGICVVTTVLFFIIQKHSESVKQAEQLQERINQEIDYTALADQANQMIDSTAHAEAMQTNAESQMQSCSFNQLSRIYDYELKLLPAAENTAAFLELNVIDKTNKNILKSLIIKTGGMYDFDCKARSYITGFNKDEMVTDGDYGTLIIQDFNFDGLEDIAVKTGFSNSGARYNFYLQTGNHDYLSDSFLTDSISFFPNIDSKTKTLNRAVRAGQYLSEKIYQYDSIAGWKFLSDTLTEW